MPRRLPAAPVPTAPAPATPAAAPDGVAATTLAAPGTIASANLTRDDLAGSTRSTLGGALFTRPGVTSTEFSPGAASRPIIRGLDTFRVRVQENGVSSGDVSDLGEDHAVPIDPLAADRVEVIRGPETLRYSSQAIGGVVSAVNDRIPEKLPEQGVHGELRSAVTTVDNGTEGAAILTGVSGNVFVRADAFGRRGSDYAIPGGVQPNTRYQADGQSVGSTVFFDQGYAGFNVARFASLYHVPGTEAALNNTRIDLEQVKLTSKGEWRPEAGFIEAVRYWLLVSDYKHNELGLNEEGADGVRATFTNREQEGRVEARQVPVSTDFGVLRGSFGVQVNHRNIGSAGEAGGLIAPSETNRVGGYVFEELRFLDAWRLQAAGRIEAARVDGTAVIFPGLVPDGTDPVEMRRSRSFAPTSGSLGLYRDLPFGVVAGLTGEYRERAPEALELFARGAHDASGTFEIGDANLRKEVAKRVEVSLRRPAGEWRFEANAYYTAFSGFITRQLTGIRCGDSFETCGEPDGEFRQVVYSQRDANFYGAELTSQLDLAKVSGGTFGIDGRYDFVRARFTNGENVPRIPPHRLGGGLYWRDGAWSARVGLLHAFAQTEVGLNDTPTPAYNLLRAEVSYTHRITDPRSPWRAFTVGIVGDNLLDDVVRNAVSFRKDEVVLPGRNVKVFANARF